MAKKKKNDDGGAGDLEVASEPRDQLVPRDLSDEEVAERQLELANKTVEILELEDKRRKSTKKANDRINELKGEVRELADQVRTRVEMVPAQLPLPGVRSDRVQEALHARRGVQRGRQDAGAAVEP